MDSRIITALLDPACYPEATTTISCIQTHISYLFLTDSYVYKVKNPVDFGFLNFTTLDRRRFYCTEEIRLNSRLAADIYLEVVEIRETDQGIKIDGDGEIIDYAVKMRRLPAEKMLDQLLSMNKVTPADIRQIASTIADFHLHAERSKKIDEYGTISVITRNWEENFSQLAEFVNNTISARDLQFIRDWVTSFMASNLDLFTRRVRDGFIRDGDGDLHLENICLDERVWIFDCIEFNDRFRYGDTLSDLAFLLMDLDLHKQRAFSEELWGHYQEMTGDNENSGLLEFYKIYRAMVRGKVASLQLLDPDILPAARTLAIAKANRYFKLARGYILRQRLKTTLFITCGLMGSGKSTLAEELALELGIELVRSDLVRKELSGLASSSRQLDEYSSGLYAPESIQTTYAKLLNLADRELSASRSIIVDATFRSKYDRHQFKKTAQAHAVEFVILRTDCPEETSRERLVSRRQLPDEASDGRWELYHQHRDTFELLTEDEGMIIFLDTSMPLDDNIDEIFNRLGLYHVA